MLNQFRGSSGNPGVGQPNPSVGQYGGQQGPQNVQPNSGGGQNDANSGASSFLETLGNFAKSQIGQQLLQKAIQRGSESGDDDVQNRRYGSVNSENTGGGRGYPTQASYTPNHSTGADVQRTYSSNNAELPSSSSVKPYGWNVSN